MNTTIESVKDEVAQGKGFKDWKHVLQQYKKDELLDINWFEKMAIELYHSRKCEEAGRELPNQERMEEIATEYSVWINKKGKEHDGNRKISYLDNITGLAEMKKIASTLLATKQGEIERLNKKIGDLETYLEYRIYKFPNSERQEGENRIINEIIEQLKSK